MPLNSESFNVPVHLPGRSTLPLNGLRVLAGDIGGTKTNLALFQATRTKLEMVHEVKMASPDYNSVAQMIGDFIRQSGGTQPDRICLGVAGPVLDGKAELTNLDWVLDSDELLKAFKVDHVSLINDLEAIAYGLSNITGDQLVQLCEGNPIARGNMAIIAPGTGLGQAGLYWDSKNYHPFPTEGGHCDFSPRSQEDYDLTRFLQTKYGIVSWEKLISGPAIPDIYSFLNQNRKGEEPAWLSGQLLEGDPSAAISTAAEEETDPVCIHTMQLFVKYLARESSNLVLKMKATGGLFIAGGIPPKISSLIIRNDFYTHFMDCDRMQHLLSEVPIYLVKDEKTGLKGSAVFGAYSI